MAAKKSYKLDLTAVLQAIDRKDLRFYSNLSDEEKKGYSPLILMRFMSSLTDQNRNAAYAVIAANDLVNMGFWTLSKHPELQHMLMCMAGLGGKQYRPWLATKRSKRSGKVDEWLMERFPDINEDELSLIKGSHDLESWKEFVKGSGEPDSRVKELVEAWKKKEV